MYITILGSRGSVPVSGDEFAKYKGATGAVRVIAQNQEIYIDAGSGIVNAHPVRDSNISILLSHAHLDHLLGIPFFEALNEKDRDIVVYYKKRNSLGISDILKKLYNPPLWPLGVYDYPANVKSVDMQDEFDLGDVHVSVMEGNHPGGVSLFRISYDGKSFVYASDYEHDPSYDEKLIEFSKDADLMLYDGQYTDEEYIKCRGYGHSTASMGIKAATAANIKQLVIIHHAPDHTDAMLDEFESQAKKSYKNISFGRCGQEIFL